MMHRHGIRAIMASPRRVRTTDSRHGLPIAPNLIERHFAAAAPNRIWLADITCIPTAEGWLYLAAIMDLFSRKIVGWAMRDHMQVEPASSALKMAIQQQHPKGGLIHHSDRGVQYASQDYRAILSAAGITASMSRKADCYDNAPMESFFHTLKTELFIIANMRPGLRPSAISSPSLRASTMAGAPTRALTAAPRIKLTSARCRSARQPNSGRSSTYRRGIAVQTTGASSLDYCHPGRWRVYTLRCIVTREVAIIVYSR